VGCELAAFTGRFIHAMITLYRDLTLCSGRRRHSVAVCGGSVYNPTPVQRPSSRQICYIWRQVLYDLQQSGQVLRSTV